MLLTERPGGSGELLAKGMRLECLHIQHPHPLRPCNIRIRHARGCRPCSHVVRSPPLRRNLSSMCPPVTPPRRCRLAEVCSTFRTLFAAQAFAGRPMRLDLNSLSWRLAERKKKAAARGELRAAVARYAPFVTHLCLKYMLDGCAGLSLRALLAPLAPHVRVLEVDDGLCTALLDALSLRLETTARGGGGGKNKAGKSGGGRGSARVGSGSGGAGSGDGTWAWASLQEVSFTGCNLWIGGWRGRARGPRALGDTATACCLQHRMDSVVAPPACLAAVAATTRTQHSPSGTPFSASQTCRQISWQRWSASWRRCRSSPARLPASSAVSLRSGAGGPAVVGGLMVRSMHAQAGQGALTQGTMGGHAAPAPPAVKKNGQPVATPPASPTGRIHCCPAPPPVCSLPGHGRGWRGLLPAFHRPALARAG